MTKKDWFRLKRYPHIGTPLVPSDRNWVYDYVKNPDKIKSHAFFPFIHKTITVRKFRREKQPDGSRSEFRKPSQKVRHIYYANHLDSNIYGFYANKLSSAYEARLRELELEDCVTAYRRIPLNPANPKSRNKCNIDFASEVFEFIKGSGNDELVAITFDIKSFFDNLNHKYLKKAWRGVVGKGLDLDDDHYNVFRNITKFSFVEERDIFSEFKNEIIIETKSKLQKKGKVTRRKYLKNRGAVAFCTKDVISDRIREKNLIKSNKYSDSSRGQLREKGIPQGSPISSVLANIYLLNFDHEINTLIKQFNGMYRRYSDDMVVVCEAQYEQAVIDLLNFEIGKCQLCFQSDKTQVFRFSKIENRYNCQEKNLQTGSLQSNTKFEYLGFSFDGKHTYLKTASLASYYRKLKRSVRRGKFFSRFGNEKNRQEIFKRRLYKKYTYLGAGRKRVYKRDPLHSNRWKVSHKYDWGNYISYAGMAANIIPDNKIASQVSRHWKKVHALLKA
ncbi:reverse transcriptase domain-containing protein [Rufibacter sp. LB8]|uniref:reverse transcriptase domain-containing protein n=1 Tax=Rufibacter sp. LB8 TaxID=2777781 RepID=UPI00178C7960